MKARYCSTSARIEICARSTFWLRARVSSRSSGPSQPSRSSVSSSGAARSGRSSKSWCAFTSAEYQAIVVVRSFEHRRLWITQASASKASRFSTASAKSRPSALVARPMPSLARAAPSPSADHRRPPRRPRYCRRARRCTATRRRSRRRRTPRRARPRSPDSAFMLVSSLISKPSKPMRSRMISPITIGDWLAGQFRVPGGVEHMRDHRHRRAPQPLERLRGRSPAPRRWR